MEIKNVMSFGFKGAREERLEEVQQDRDSWVKMIVDALNGKLKKMRREVKIFALRWPSGDWWFSLVFKENEDLYAEFVKNLSHKIPLFLGIPREDEYKKE